MHARKYYSKEESIVKKFIDAQIVEALHRRTSAYLRD